MVVSAATSRPIVNAHVEYSEDGITQSTVTDAKGVFEFSNGRLGVITVSATGFGTQYRRWPPQNAGGLRIALGPPVVVDGTLVDNVKLEPVRGIVTAFVHHAASFVSRSTIVEENGIFRLEDLPEGIGLVVANAVGYAPAVTSAFTVEMGDWRNVHLRLSADAKASGTVTDGDGNPVRGAQIRVSYDSTVTAGSMVAGFVGGKTVTDEDGQFGISGLVPDSLVTVYGEKANERTNSVTISVGAGQVHEGVVLRFQ